jgi:periplasmic protein CpxP/Spy
MKQEIVLIGTLGLCLVAFAAPESPVQNQGSGTPTSAAEKLDKLEALSKQLNLTPDQKGKLLPILRAEAPKMQAIKDNTSLTGMQKLQQIRALHEQTEPQVKAILSQQQFDQLQKIRQQEIEKMIEKKRANQ